MTGMHEQPGHPPAEPDAFGFRCCVWFVIKPWSWLADRALCSFFSMSHDSPRFVMLGWRVL